MADLARRLRGGRQAVASGHLTLDREKARTKLRQFRLPDPHFYVLQFVRTASVLGATRIEFAVGPSTTMCLFDAALPPGALDDIWSLAFAERTSDTQEALHNLALGLASAQALNPALIEVESGAAKLVVRDDTEELETCEPAPHTKITVIEKFRFGHIAEFFASFLGELPEGRALTQACAHSLLEVRVNEQRIDKTWTRIGPTLTEQHPSGIARVLGLKSFEHLTLVLLRDDVSVLQMRARPVLMPACAVLNSRDAPMDLTGLTLRETPPSFPRDVRSTYHRLVLDQLGRASVANAQKQQILEQLCEEVETLPPEQVGAGTRELIQHLLADAIFLPVSVESRERVALHQKRDRVIEFSTRRLSLPGENVTLPYIASDSPLPKLLARIGYAVRDVTVPLSRKSRKLRNRARFEAQPQRPPRKRPPADNLVTVKVGELVGHIETTKEFQNGVGHVRVDGRVLFEREGPIPYDIEVSGPLEPNEYYDNVDRDETFDELALMLIRAARRLFGQFANSPDRATLLLDRILRGEFESDLLGMLGYGRNEAEKFLTRHRVPVDRDDNYDWFLRESGALADAAIFASPTGKHRTLREIVEHPNAPAFSAMYGSEVEKAAKTRLVLDPTPSQRRLVQQIRPDATEVLSALRRESAESALMSRAPFVPRKNPVPLYVHRVAGEGFAIEMELLGGVLNTGEADVYIVWRNRLLARHRWSAPQGKWRVVVRSDDVRPVDTYDDVERDELFEQITDAFARTVPTAIAGWRRLVGEKGRLDARGWELYIESALRHGDVDAIRLPAWRLDGAAWESVLAPLSELAESNRRNGRLRYARPGEPPKLPTEADELVVQLPMSIDPRLLKIGPLAGARLAFVEEPADDAVRAWRLRAPRPSWQLLALVQGRELVDGFEVSTMLEERDGDPRHIVELVWQGRVLERVEGPDVAHFHSIVRSDKIGPNEDFTHAAAGREEALVAAAEFSRKVLIKGCSLVSGSDELRATLLKIATSNPGHEDEAWWQALQRAPLLETPSGYESIERRARRRAVLREGGGVLEEVAELLRVARGRGGDLVHEFTLAGLSWADPGQEELCHAEAGAVTVRPDHELVQAAAAGEPLALHFLASCVFTQINAYYLEISDADELELQKRLLRTNL